MNLKEELISKIDAYGGLDAIITDLKKHEKTAPWNRKMVFSGTIIFLKQLYKGNINLQWCALGHKKLAAFVIRYFNKWGQRKDCKTLIFVADLIEYKMESLKKIRELV